MTKTFRLKNETKGALRYEELDDKGAVATEAYAVGTLYVRKSAFDGAPNLITVTIDVLKGA